MAVVLVLLIVIAWLGWRKAFTEYQRAEMNQRHYQIAMEGWRGTIDSLDRLTREARAWARPSSLVVTPEARQERVH